MSLTIVECMQAHAKNKPDSIAFRYLVDPELPPQNLTFGQLWQEAASVAQFLRGIAQPGSRIMLFFPPGMAYIKAFYGCLLAGMVAVPLYPPRRNVKSDRVIKVAQSCQSEIALTTASELAAVSTAWNEQNQIGLKLQFHAADQIDVQATADYVAAPQDPDAAAFLQYTSGSTGTPKGVIITHANIVANARHLSLMSSGSPSDVFVNWLPLFHDLGLVTAVLWPVVMGATSILMAPATFVRDPVVWLKAITRYRGTMGGAPNFAFDLCINKIAEADLDGLDLSSWRIAYNAAEPVRSATLDQFVARFGRCGFRAEAFYPSYGMAEATVFITGGNAAALPIMPVVNKKLIAERALELVPEDSPLASRIVACGAASEPHDVRVVDPETRRERAPGEVGEIWFSGPSVSPGYWQLPELSRDTFGQKIVDGPDNGHAYLRTGDLGLIWEGQLYVTGRIKDLIILRGRNYYPQDIEAAAMRAHHAVRAGHVAAFSQPENEVEQLVVVAEIEREFFRSVNADEVASAIRQQVLLEYEVGVDQVVLLKPYKIPVTSSGKIARRQTRQMLQDGELDVIARSDTGIRLAEREYTAPTTENEILLCGIWQQVLKQPRISVHDNFFDLGGDSVAAIEISAGLRQHVTLLELEMSHLHEFPTISQLAQLLDLKLAHASAQQARAADGNKAAGRKAIRI